MTINLSQIAKLRALVLRFSCDAVCDKYGKQWRGTVNVHVNSRKPVVLECANDLASYNAAILEAHKLANDTRAKIYEARMAG